jgi:hypothetical protein
MAGDVAVRGRGGVGVVVYMGNGGSLVCSEVLV